MSDTLYVVCADCKKAVRVGQAGYGQPSRAYLYGGERERENFTRFYDEHLGHDLRFGGMNLVDTFDVDDGS